MALPLDEPEWCRWTRSTATWDGHGPKEAGCIDEEYFQQVEASDTLVNQLDHFLNLHLRLHVVNSSHFQWRRSLDTVKSEVGKDSPLTWSWDVLAVEPVRLPTSNRFRESHGRERTPLPLLDTQTPAHLDDMGLRVTHFCFLHRLGTDGENMFEKAPVRSTPQKVFTH